ncbi:unnamed protein product [Echinostoma caproni]|uniref:Clathrin light chain n=1 Tax=Echinostoma caproni TaxID=27848 RepID=A0A183AGG1_9TREM|nr:unnamed protein product [Echinostoma caproni]
MSISSVSPGGFNPADFSDPEYMDLGDNPTDALAKTSEELQRNLELNRARNKDENVWHLLHELDRRTRLLSKWHNLRALRFG